MKNIIEKKLEKEMFNNQYEYFFVFFDSRFEYAVELWIKELEKKFKKKFKPIWVLSTKQNNFFKKENFIIFNETLPKLQLKFKLKNIFYLEDPEETNKEFSESNFIQDLINKLAEKQEKIFILGFTSSHLNISNPKIKILGPIPKIATKFDNKWKHIELFRYLNLPTNNTRLYKNTKDIRAKEKYPFYISASYSSGGHESGIVNSEQELDNFYSRLRYENKNNPFLVADLITDIKFSPNVNAVIVGKNNTRVIYIMDQFLRGLQYLGNIYPSKINKKQEQKIIEITKKVGNYLAEQGFRGLFGLDFVIDSKDNIFTVDLNPRRQGAYLINILMALPKINIPEIELKLALGERVDDFNYQDFQKNFVVAHSKIKPYISNTRILNNFKIGSIQKTFEKIGSEYKTIFYTKDCFFEGGTAGYIVLSGDNYEEVKNKIMQEREKIISENFEKYFQK